MNKIFEDVISRVPDYKEFMTVDEMNSASKALAKEHPDIVEEFEFGITREGDKIIGLKIGKGKQNALVFGLPHPNEPIGTMMLDYFTKELAENKKLRDELDYTWYIVKAWDSDGTRLNEGWFKGPFTLYNYARNFFRPAGHQQVDWTFPIEYKELKFTDSIPETVAMMNLIDKIKPRFIYSLHNAGFGGVYWYLSRDIPKVYGSLKEAAKKQNVPLNLGEPEAPYCKAFAPAIYKELGIRDKYNYLEKYGVKDIPKAIKVGTCSADYAGEKYKSFTMLTELPYFYSEKIIDLSDSGENRGEIVRKSLEQNRKSETFILDSLKKTRKYMAKNNPFLLALDAFTGRQDDYEAAVKMTYEDENYSKKNATVAEKFDNEWIKKFYKMLSFGLLTRANETELFKMKKTKEENKEKEKALSNEFNAAEKKLQVLSDELEANIKYSVVPIKKLVSIQLECGLLVAEYLKNV